MLLFPVLVVFFILLSMSSSQYYSGVGQLKNSLPPTYQPAPVSGSWFTPGCSFDMCFDESCCSWLGIPVLLWVVVACFVIVLFVILLIFQIVQLLGRIRDK